MSETDQQTGPAQWVVWNGASGLLAMATMGRVEGRAGGRKAWLAQPFDMVGPISLDELEARGWVAFAACLVMSRQRWQEDQVALRQASYARRRAAQARLHKDQARHHEGWGPGWGNHRPLDERPHRVALNLPLDGRLQASQIKAAFRRLAQKMHPDVGGTPEAFARLTEARKALLGLLD